MTIMGFFFRTKKPKKETSPSKEQRGGWGTSHYKPRPPPPPGGAWYNPNDPYQLPPPQPIGLLPAPPGWVPQSPTPHYQQPASYPAPIVVNQHHYYLGQAPPSQAPDQSPLSGSPPSKLNLGSVLDLAKEACNPKNLDSNVACNTLQECGTQLLNQSAALYDQISDRFNDIMTLIDGDRYVGNEKDLFAWQSAQSAQPASPSPTFAVTTEKGGSKSKPKPRPRDHPKGQTSAAAAVISGSFFAKVELYANSKLPMDLPPLRLYIPTYPLLCLAAQYAERVYDRPMGAETNAHVDADWKTGSKAMVIKSVPMDYMNTIVFAIRGTATFMDWAVNLNAAPTSPMGFLDDPGNLCHAGFLGVARKMVAPVAKRLRQLLEEDPSRASYSLLITGHSAGGAVAALLYSHMLSTSKAAMSELNTVASCFKRVHCITFGTPPVSLIPLQKPDDMECRPQLKKSLFMSFLNEGDPVARADKAYVKSLLDLFAAPAPGSTSTLVVGSGDKKKTPKEKSSKSSLGSSKSSKSNKSSKPSSGNSGSGHSSTKTKTPSLKSPTWKVPPSTLSSPGRIVVLRSGDPKARLKGKKTVEERLNEGVVAHIATDEQLRKVVWGDPVCHVMRLYAGRIETLAVGAVTARGY
ncbi:mono and diacylglycerol lipase [Podospora aff. communis PSN243]|uniref:Mono and diacylglycerol lipase n=1 Tax=Podospora aff. communis PSN243 TaxID=3040156 RepID=A0AAV9GEL0_9PEZI|nr:mono and diacylglycerol lipase [Podospora aff. communis PSN243]